MTKTMKQMWDRKTQVTQDAVGLTAWLEKAEQRDAPKGEVCWRVAVKKLN